jgi:hypothetical protein
MAVDAAPESEEILVFESEEALNGVAAPNPTVGHRIDDHKMAGPSFFVEGQNRPLPMGQEIPWVVDPVKNEVHPFFLGGLLQGFKAIRRMPLKGQIPIGPFVGIIAEQHG